MRHAIAERRELSYDLVNICLMLPEQQHHRKPQQCSNNAHLQQFAIHQAKQNLLARPEHVQRAHAKVRSIGTYTSIPRTTHPLRRRPRLLCSHASFALDDLPRESEVPFSRDCVWCSCERIGGRWHRPHTGPCHLPLLDLQHRRWFDIDIVVKVTCGNYGRKPVGQQPNRDHFSRLHTACRTHCNYSVPSSVGCWSRCRLLGGRVPSGGHSLSPNLKSPQWGGLSRNLTDLDPLVCV